MQNLNPRQIVDYIKNVEPKPILLDVREEWEFKICHIENSILIPMRHISENLHHLPIDKEIIVICHHGIRSRIIAGFLESRGYQNIINLEGGVDAWADFVDRTMEKY